MGRILYAVMGDASGHVSEALAVAQGMPQHDFLFLGGGKVHELQAEGYPVENLPMLSTFYKNNAVDLWATAQNGLKVLWANRNTRRRIHHIIREFQPDLILANYEYFTPLAAMEMSRPCISIDHQHILTACRFNPPLAETLSRFMTCSCVRSLYSNCSQYIIVSFFDLPPKNPGTTIVLPPILRKAVKTITPRAGDHILVYQTSSTFHRIFPVLQAIDARFLIYGFGARPPRRNLIFKPYSPNRFLQDMASSRYVITNGGHNVICEALHFGKPVLSLPIANAHEQFVNAYYLARYGYGQYSTALPPISFFRDFEKDLEKFKSRIGRSRFYGNDALVERLGTYL
jgi:uncharacterized protein (TIGR00661 family)